MIKSAKRIVKAALRQWERVARKHEITHASHIDLGASVIRAEGWCPTDRHLLDLLKPTDFSRYWKPATRAAFMSEHVWEHLTEAQGSLALQHCFQYLKPGGWLRIAVPDGLFPDAEYIEWVRPGGSGPGADDHKMLYTYHSLTNTLQKAGFEVQILEYWDENGKFHATEWDPAKGHIRRSARFDARNQGGTLKYTSLILDGIKPA